VARHLVEEEDPSVTTQFPKWFYACRFPANLAMSYGIKIVSSLGIGFILLGIIQSNCLGGDFTAVNGIVLSVSNFGATPITKRISLRIFHAANATTTQGDNITGQLGVDNIRAVPEPGAAMLGLLTGVGCLVRRRRAYRK